MPNYVKNRITFDCGEEKAREILTAVQYDPDPEHPDQTGFGTIDFNKLIPMPPSLNIESGSKTDHGIEVYLTAVNPETESFGLPKMEAEAFNALVSRLNGSRYFGSYSPKLTDEKMQEYGKQYCLTDLADFGKAAVNNLLNYGATTWYEWCVRNWGTKWNSYDPEKDEDSRLVFCTAWSAPHPILEELTARFPGVYITHEWADEDIGQNCGQREYLNGECVGEYVPDTAKEAIEYAVGVWGSTPEEFGYVLNANGSEYIYSDIDRYDLIELFGKPALFTNERLSKADIPEGLYLCHIRGTDDDPGAFAALEPCAKVNHAASIITKEPMDFGKDGYILFTDDTEPNFTGRKVTFLEYMNSPQFDAEQGQSPGLTMN